LEHYVPTDKVLPSEGPSSSIQSALLYTTSDGERRIRVATQAVPMTNRITDLMTSVDSEAVCTLLAKQALDVSVKTNLDNARNRLQQSCVDMIRASKEGDKRTVSGYTMPNQGPDSGNTEKSIPKNLELLPLYTLSMLKNVAFRGGTDVHPDERIAAHMSLVTMFVEDTISFIHPRFYSIHNMEPSVGEPCEEDSVGEEKETVGRDNILLPSAVSLSVEQLSSDGIFFLDNGIDTYIWVGRAADPSKINAFFGVDSLENVNVSQINFNTGDNDLASRMNNIIMALREETNGVPNVETKTIIVREGDAGVESRFFWNLIEDRAQFNGGTYNYEEFMQFINSSQSAPQGPNGMGPGRMPPGAPSQPYRGGGAPPPPAPLAGGYGQPPAPSGPPPPPSMPGQPGPPSSAPAPVGPPAHMMSQGGPPSSMPGPPVGMMGQGGPPQPPNMPGPPRSMGAPPPSSHMQQPAPFSGPPGSGHSSGPPSGQYPAQMPPPNQRGPPPPPTSGGYPQQNYGPPPVQQNYGAPPPPPR